MSVQRSPGAVIFGGVDTTKFIGGLAKLPIVPPAQTPRGADRYYVYMTSLSVTAPDGTTTNAFKSASSSKGEPVFLDSGGTLSRLPATMFKALGDGFPGARYDRSSGFYVVNCNSAGAKGTVDFGFGSKTIRVAFSDFIWRANSAVCVLGALPLESEKGEPVLGASFLRAAYVVYDQDNRNIHLAQAANCGSGTSGILSIGSGTDAVPSSTGRCTATPTRGATTRPSATGTGGEGCTNCDNSGIITSSAPGQPAATGSSGGGGGGSNGKGPGSAAGRIDAGLVAVAVASCLTLLFTWLS